MSWVHSLYDTYERCAKIAGVQLENQNDVLLPVGHNILPTQVVAHLDKNGGFLGAELQPEKIIAPCTEDSASRTSGVAPHPLFDTLQYVAGDYPQSGNNESTKHYQEYIKQLEEWCGRPNPHPMVLAILAYLKKGSLIEDLVAHKILHLTPEGIATDQWWTEQQGSSFPAIKTVPFSKIVIRFTVDSVGVENRPWKNDGVRESFRSYLSWQQQSGQSLCYVSGVETACAVKHPKNITNSPNAKLISANDNSGFTYRGRFQNVRQAVGIGYEVSQKAHNALRWLVKSRGLYVGSQVVISWSTCGKKLPSPISDTDEVFGLHEDITAADNLTTANVDTGHNYAQRLTCALLSIRCDKLDKHDDVSVMVVDNATKGRLAITYYRELKAGEYLERVLKWHTSCIWRHTYKKNNDSFIGAPSIRDIAAAAYGVIAEKDKNLKLVKSTIERLLPCVFDGARPPADLVNAAVNRASNPVAFDKQWEWNKTLSIACALYKKQHEKEAYLVALEEQRHDRDYLYGRLLAVADWIEGAVLREQGDGKQERATNAMRYMNAFTQRPFHIWPIIAQQINPYEMKLDLKFPQYKKLMSEIMAQFQEGDFEKAKKLSGAYLLGYHCQRQRFFDQIKESSKKTMEAKEDEGNEPNE